MSGAASLLILLAPHSLQAAGPLLDISTLAQVSGSGKVEITLRLKNNGDRALYNIQPVFHFHHSMRKMPRIPVMEAGEVISLKTSAHPPVVRVGRYPLMAALNYQTAPDEKTTHSQIHADSFYFREPVVSAVSGEITSKKEADGHLLQILLRNNSPSLKNIRLMLLLPPGIVAQGFNGMMGLTMRPDEQKYFTVPVSKRTGNPGGNYPVYLMVEYAETLKHYVNVIPGEIHYSLTWDESAGWAQSLVFVFLLCSIIWFLKNKSRRPASGFTN